MFAQTKRLLFAVAVVIFVVFTIFLSRIELTEKSLTFIDHYGYVGFFGLSFIGGLNLFVPSAHLALVSPLLRAGLNPWLLVVLASIATTLADGLGYALGAGGRKVAPKLGNTLEYLALKLISRYPVLAPVVLFFWAAVVPLPNELLVVPAGLVKYGVLRTLAITLSGSVIFNILAVQTASVVLSP